MCTYAHQAVPASAVFILLNRGVMLSATWTSKFPQQVVAFFHQKWDKPEILSIAPRLNVLKLTFEWIRNGGE
jgi:hypothetical protein